MPRITFDEVYDKSFESSNSNVEMRSALNTMWDNGVKVFEKLYGDKAHDVIKLCYEVSPRFCLHVVTVVYGLHWNWSDPSDYDKSLMTNLVLILDKSFNQFKVLMLTFLHSAQQMGKNGHTILLAAIEYLSQNEWLSPEDKATAEQLLKDDPSYTEDTNTELSDEDLEITKLAVMTALKKDADTVQLTKIFPLSKMQNLIFHANTYVGCPRVWDASSDANNHITAKL